MAISLPVDGNHFWSAQKGDGNHLSGGESKPYSFEVAISHLAIVSLHFTLNKAFDFIAETQRRRERREFNVFHGEIGNYRMNALFYVFTLTVKEVSKEKSRYFEESLRLCVSAIKYLIYHDFQLRNLG